MNNTIYIDQIINTIEDYKGILENSIDFNDYYNLPDELVEEEIHWHAGSDKIAIDCIDYYPEDYVIKVPIAGEFIYIDDLSEEDIKLYKKDGFKELPLEDMIVRYRNNNPCIDELKVYEAACDEDLCQFFAQEEPYTKNSIIQEKVIVHEEDDHFWDKYEDMYRRNYKNYKRIISTLSSTEHIPVEIIVKLYEDYGVNDTNKFLQFIEEMGINDLDFYNWGINKYNTLVVFDYCGFENWTIK